METKSDNYEDYRRAKVREGEEFQDFIMERLHLIGTILQPLCSRAGQLKGENLFGLEIKNDEKMGTWGNIYIEIAEKARPRAGDYVPSGIFRSDNTWLYGIGDRLVFFIFPKSTLRNLYAKRNIFGLKEKTKPTSLGFVIPLTLAEKLYARKIVFGFDGEIQSVMCGGAQSPIPLADIKFPESFQPRLL